GVLAGGAPDPRGSPIAALRIRLRPRRAFATRTKPSCHTIPSDRAHPPPVAGAPFPYVRTQNPRHCGLISHGPSPEPTLSLGSDDPPASPRRGRMGLDGARLGAPRGSRQWAVARSLSPSASRSP